MTEDNGFREYKRLLLDTDKRHEERLAVLAEKHDRQHNETVEAINRLATDLASLRGEFRAEARSSGRQSGGIVGGLVAAILTGIVAAIRAIWKM